MLVNVICLGKISLRKTTAKALHVISRTGAQHISDRKIKIILALFTVITAIQLKTNISASYQNNLTLVFFIL